LSPCLLLINVILGLCAFRDFGWVAARTVGTAIEKVVLFERYQLLIAAVKLDAQMHLTLLVMALLFVSAADVAFMVADIVVLALAVPWAVALYYAARSERQCLMQFAIVVGAAQPAYVAVRLAQSVYDAAWGVVHGGRNQVRHPHDRTDYDRAARAHRDQR
jgi:hypothetical protein